MQRGLKLLCPNAWHEPRKNKSPLLRLFGRAQERPPLFWADRNRYDHQSARLHDNDLLGWLLELGRRALF